MSAAFFRMGKAAVLNGDTHTNVLTPIVIIIQNLGFQSVHRLSWPTREHRFPPTCSWPPKPHPRRNRVLRQSRQRIPVHGAGASHRDRPPAETTHGSDHQSA